MNYLRIVLYFAFFFVAMLLWNNWQKENAPKLQQTVTQAVQNQSGLSSDNNSPLPSAALEHMTGNTANAFATAPSTAPQSLITVNTDVLSLKINSLGGDIVEADLPKYPVDQKTPDIPLTLLNNDPKSLYITQTGLTSIPGIGNNPIPFQSAQKSYTLADGQKVLNVDLTYQNPEGIRITKTLTFKPGQYVIGVSYHVENTSQTLWQSRFYMQTKRRQYIDASSDHLIGFHPFFGIAISSPDKPYEKYSFKNLNESPLNQTIKGGWLAVMQHYFLSAWVPNNTQDYFYYSQSLGNDTYVTGLIGPSVSIAPQHQQIFTSQLYIGPEIASNLDAIAPHLSLTIDYGWLWFIGVLIFWLLKHVYDIVGNWGWAIIIVTLIIKLVFYKLSETSYKSMAKMRALQPKLEQLKDRYGTDRQQLSKATMELYKKEGVNPLGGCLPIVVQIPVFIALYSVLVGSVELRQAPFILWIQNLAAADPYYILPVLMGVSMFIQQRLSPAPSDPTQAKVMMFLPVMMTVLFLNFPSGLVLYWVVNNLVSILQQRYITKRFEAGAYKKLHKKAKKK